MCTLFFVTHTQQIHIPRRYPRMSFHSLSLTLLPTLVQISRCISITFVPVAIFNFLHTHAQPLDHQLPISIAWRYTMSYCFLLSVARNREGIHACLSIFQAHRTGPAVFWGDSLRTIAFPRPNQAKSKRKRIAQCGIAGAWINSSYLQISGEEDQIRGCPAGCLGGRDVEKGRCADARDVPRQHQDSGFLGSLVCSAPTYYVEWMVLTSICIFDASDDLRAVTNSPLSATTVVGADLSDPPPCFTTWSSRSLRDSSKPALIPFFTITSSSS
jgi:hypothetical protein